MQMLQLEGDQKSSAGSLTCRLFPPKTTTQRNPFLPQRVRKAHIGAS